MSQSPTVTAAGRWATYTAAASAAAMAASADGAIVYSGDQDISIPQFNYQLLNFNGDAYYDLQLKNYIFFGGNYQGAYVPYFPGKMVTFTNAYTYVAALGAGFQVDAASVTGSFFGSMAYGASNPNAQFNNVQGAFIGLAFPINGVNHYAWVRVTIDNAAGVFIINDWAYNDVAGQGIATGQIPTPGSLGLLAAGALGLGALRNRRKA